MISTTDFEEDANFAKKQKARRKEEIDKIMDTLEEGKKAREALLRPEPDEYKNIDGKKYKLVMGDAILLYIYGGDIKKDRGSVYRAIIDQKPYSILINEKGYIRKGIPNLPYKAENHKIWFRAKDQKEPLSLLLEELKNSPSKFLRNRAKRMEQEFLKSAEAEEKDQLEKGNTTPLHECILVGQNAVGDPGRMVVLFYYYKGYIGFKKGHLYAFDTTKGTRIKFISLNKRSKHNMPCPSIPYEIFKNKIWCLASDDWNIAIDKLVNNVREAGLVLYDEHPRSKITIKKVETEEKDQSEKGNTTPLHECILVGQDAAEDPKKMVVSFYYYKGYIGYMKGYLHTYDTINGPSLKLVSLDGRSSRNVAYNPFIILKNRIWCPATDDYDHALYMLIDSIRTSGLPLYDEQPREKITKKYTEEIKPENHSRLKIEMKSEINSKRFDKVSVGWVFTYKGILYMKISEENSALNLLDLKIYTIEDGEIVIAAKEVALRVTM